MPFSYATFGQFLATLQARLYLKSDANQQFWTQAELLGITQEVLKYWNSITGFYRTTMSFNLTQGQWWYDLTQQPGTVRPLTTTDFNLLQALAFHLLEPPMNSYPLSWAGSNQYAETDLLTAIERSVNETLGNSECNLTRSLLAAGAGVLNLPDSVLAVKRAAWIPPGGSGFSATSLEESDTATMNAYDSDWKTAAQAPPSSYLQTSEPPLTLAFDRTPPLPSQYEIIASSAVSALSDAAATTLPIPDDWAWVAKYGALAQLFSKESLARDPLRAKYCQQRFEEGIELLKAAPCVLSVYSNGNEVDVDSVRNADDFEPDWQAEPEDAPKTVYTMGLNLVAVSPAPDVWPYALTLDVVANQPVPLVSGDFMQIPRDSYDALLGEVQHVAALKQGGAEFMSTIPLHQAFLRAASIYNEDLAKMGFYEKQMAELSQLQRQRQR